MSNKNTKIPKRKLSDEGDKFAPIFLGRYRRVRSSGGLELIILNYRRLVNDNIIFPNIHRITCNFSRIGI